MDQTKVELGQVAVSRAGRDAGKAFIVVRVIDNGFVLVSDGKTRKISNPKKKNVKHLRFEPIVATAVSEKLFRGQEVKDDEIAEVLEGVIDQDGQG